MRGLKVESLLYSKNEVLTPACLYTFEKARTIPRGVVPSTKTGPMPRLT